MTLQEYKRLEGFEQLIILWEHGIRLGVRFDEAHTILLFQIEGFYVEAFYNYKSKSITKFRSFKTVDQLRPYLEKIDVGKLLLS